MLRFYVFRKMFRVITVQIVAGLLLLGLFPVTNAQSTALAENISVAENQVIVELNKGVDITAINQTYNTTTIKHLKGAGNYLLAAPVGQNADNVVAQMQSDSRLIYAEANYKAYLTETNQIFIYQDQNSTAIGGVSTDEAVNQARSQWAFNRIELAAAQKLSQGKGVTIALIDSGVSTEHPELKTHLLPGYNILDGTGNVSDVNGHGTFVAGLLTLTAPQAQILPIRAVGSEGYGTVADAADALRYAADNNAKVINISLGLYYPSKTFLAAVQYAQSKGAVIVASAGNQNSNQPRYPAAYPQVVGIAATSQVNQKASFSNYGRSVRLSAPGVALYSTSRNGGYASGEGTSFAAPMVAGTMALVWANKPGWNGAQVMVQLEQAAINLNQLDPVYGVYLGKGLLNSYRSCSDK